jgi:hypothetical protein
MERWRGNLVGMCIDVYVIVQRLPLKSLYEKSEQGVAITFLWMKELGARRIHTKLSRALGDVCYSPAAIEGWLARYREGDR